MRRHTIHLVLFLLTVASTWRTGGWGYSLSIILILLGHELGHYFMSRRHGMRATLPFFLPFPLSPFGTLGAIIRMEGPIYSRKALFDTGVAGPLTSFLLSLPAIAIGLKLSTLIPRAHIQEGTTLHLADPLLFALVQRLVLGDIPEGFEVILHPIGYAGWVGLFVTALNLFPVGQLDGGHIAYAIFGQKSRAVFLIAIAAMGFITVFLNPGWFLLLILMVLFGFRHPRPLDDETPLDGRRKAMGGFMFLVFLLSFTPSPFPQLTEEIKRFLGWP
ncbi:MAG: site-2 protease family protein [Desulfobacterota bacterium]|nr:site-2 protease family protein [Thermodesulfobacteriota bacterium]